MMNLAKLSNIKIAGIDFNNTATVITDLKKQFPCLEIDGLIGSNIMKHAVWQIDNESKKIIITNTVHKIDTTNYNQIINFTTNKQGNPYVNISLGNQIIETLVDLGNNANINIENKYRRNIEKSNIKNEISFNGNSAVGIFKEKADKFSVVTHTKIKKLQMDGLEFNNKIITFTKGDSKIGTSFFKNYNYIIDYNSKKLYLQKLPGEKNDQYISYGFGRVYEDNKVIISELLQNSEASKKLKLGDQIITFNGKDWSNLTQNEWCNIYKNLEWPNILKLKIKRGDNYKELTLEKSDFLK